MGERLRDSMLRKDSLESSDHLHKGLQEGETQKQEVKQEC